jgi:ectoine hydroxylase-related dioxygenase (phytanoyl-CoA dioxygenase family)
MTSIVTLPPSSNVNECLEVIFRDGCVILDQFASVERMDAIRAELDPYLERTPFGEGDFVGRNTKRMGALVVKSTAIRDLLMHPTVLGVMSAVLGPHCALFQLNLTQAVQIFPGEPAQIFHRDDEMFPYPNKACEFMVNALWAYDDFTEANGATRVVPGSHRQDAIRDPDPSQIAYAEMRRGSLLIYLGSALHSGGANRSDRPRTALINSYSLGWLRQAENLYLSVPPTVARTLPEPLRKLIGYAIHEPQLGWYEGQDPAAVLADDVPETLAARDYMPPEILELLRQHYEPLRAGVAAK